MFGSSCRRASSSTSFIDSKETVRSLIDSYEELLGRAVELENKGRFTKSGKPVPGDFCVYGQTRATRDTGAGKAQGGSVRLSAAGGTVAGA